MNILKNISLKIIYSLLFIGILFACSEKAQAAGVVTVTVSKTFVRVSTAEGSGIVATAGKDASFTVVKSVNAEGILWYEIILKDGETKGYIRGDLVSYDAAGSLENTYVPVTPDENDVVTYVEKVTAKANTDVRVREGASTKTGIVDTLLRRTEVTIDYYKLGTDGLNWYHVYYDKDGQNRNGYIRSDLVTLLGNLTVRNPNVEEEEIPEFTGPSEPERVPVGEEASNLKPIESTWEEKPAIDTPVLEDMTSVSEETKPKTPKPINPWMIVSIVEFLVILGWFSMEVFVKLKKNK